jgi:hypothetical protein
MRPELKARITKVYDTKRRCWVWVAAARDGWGFDTRTTPFRWMRAAMAFCAQKNEEEKK